MPWFNVWDGLKNKTCRYLLQRYLGQFLEDKLNLEQLNVELFNGRATVKNVSLKVDALNELFESQGWSVEVTRGRIGIITVTVPWNALMTNDSSIEISDLFICLRPVQRQDDGTSMLESMWSSVSSSMQLAQECMKQSDNVSEAELGTQNDSIEGLEKFAETIDNVLTRIKAKCTNVILRLEYLPEGSAHGIAIIIKIKTLNYQNDAENEGNMQSRSDNEKEYVNRNESASNKTLHILSTFQTHNISLNDVYIYTEEFKVACKKHFKKSHSQTNFTEHETLYGITTDCTGFSTNHLKLETEYLCSLKCSMENEFCTENVFKTKPIPIIKVNGTQKIILKMKQSEEIKGPKVILDIEFGHICLIVTPRQIHLLGLYYDLFCGEPYTEVISKNVDSEQDLSSNLESRYISKTYKPSMTGGLGKQNIWSEVDEYEVSAINNTVHEQAGNKLKQRYCGSLSSSLSSSSTAISSSRFQRKIANMDICGDISKFNIKISSIMAIIIQEDVLVEQNLTINNNPLNEKSLLDLLNIADQYFLLLNNDSGKINAKLHSMCTKNHISLQLTPIIVEGVQQRNKNILLLKMSITSTNVDLCEVLDEKSTPLIKFKREDNSSKVYNQHPEVTINIKSTSPYNIKRKGKELNPPGTELDIYMKQCEIELDISIYDRLSAIFGPTPFKKSIYVPKSCSKTLRKDLSDSYNIVKFSSKEIDLKLRFPIVDVRPIHDPEHIPWWKQNIRSDFIMINLLEFHLVFRLCKIEIKANEINAFYCENCMKDKWHLLRVSPSSDSNINDAVNQYPRVIIETSRRKYGLNNSGRCESESCSVGVSLPFSAKRVCRQSDTMHSKHEVSEESETFLLPGETQELQNFCDSTMTSSKLQIKCFLPVASLQLESKELYEKIYNRLNSDVFMWEPSSPITKSSREYNAEPQTKNNILNVGLIDSFIASPTIIPHTVKGTSTYGQKAHTESTNLFASSFSSSFKSEENCGTRPECSLHESVSGSIYISTQEACPKESYNSLIIQKKQSGCSFEITIEEGLLAINVPTRDAENRILQDQIGKFLIKLHNFVIFCVTGHNSNEHLAYLCLNLKNVEVFHCGLLPLPVEPFNINNVDADFPKYMQSTFYKTPISSKKETGMDCSRREMVSIVIEIKKIPEQRIKRLKITTGIQKATLRHNPALPSHTWLNQLLDFLDVMDFPVPGYEPFGIITEMQLHLWDCAIDYRPKNFPYRAVVEIGSFNISSNIVSSLSGCTLRFAAEECVLAIAPFDNTKDAYPDCQITNLPSSDLVHVLDIGLVDISLRISDKSTERCPKLDLRTSIQDVHLRTCSDSGTALAQLIAYLANYGDNLHSNYNKSTSSSTISSTYSDAELPENSSVEISEAQQRRVNTLMAEAVRESVLAIETSDSLSDKNAGSKGIEVYYFPDEGTQPLNKDYKFHSPDDMIGSLSISDTDNSQENNCNELNDIINFEANVMSNSSFFINDNLIEALPQIKEDLGDICDTNKHETDDVYTTTKDDDYCLIADDEKSYMSNFGIKNVNLADDPLRIVDNHFCLPNSKPDLLKPPENFPMAILRYTLCEMTFTWHMYGGTDFPSIDDADTFQPGLKPSRDANKGQKSHMSEAYKHGVSYSKGKEGILYEKKPKDTLTWKTKGGHKRNHSVLVEIQLSKVRFSHEVYPASTSHASRQVLIVNEIEIRDRLQSSDINKFLYHPKSNNLPNKSIQNMIVLKALHVRPYTNKSLSPECSLRISLLPLRLHIDQDTLLFLVDFCTNLGESCNNEVIQSQSGHEDVTPLASRDAQDPVMIVEDMPEAVQDLHARRLVSTNLDLLMDDKNQNGLKKNESDVLSSTGEDSLPTYFKEVVFSPEVLIRFDYHGRRVELSRGPVAGLLMGLGQLQCSEIRLRKIVYKRGLLGFEKLMTFLCKEWLRDIKKNQLPNILSGVGPTYAFIQLFQGIYDLFWLPIEQFQRDGRIIRGLQLGAQSFTARTALAALEITSRIIQLLQFTAETAFDMVSPGPTVRRQRNLRKGKRKRQHRPKNIREGVTNAYTIMKEGINDSANTLIETAVSEHDQKGYTGAVGAVMRQIPQLVVCPAVLATQATSNILGGVKSSLVPEAKLEARDKWKNDTD